MATPIRRPVLFTVLALGLLTLVAAPTVRADVPELFTEPFHQSPVRSDPGDLLFVAGYGFEPGVTVYYELLATTAPQPPASVPPSRTWFNGTADVVDQTADNLTLRLPPEMNRDEGYALWIKNSEGNWVGPVLINDARPLWFTPPFVFKKNKLATLDRELKVVGRNLHPVPGSSTSVRLVGFDVEAVYTRTAENDNDPDTTVERYAAAIGLPKNMSVGTYTVQLNRGDGRWIEVPDQLLSVVADPSNPSRHSVGDYSGSGSACKSNDGQDDTPCVLAAIDDAASSGGEVFFPKGRWDLQAASSGIVVPAGVALKGSAKCGRTRFCSTVVRGDAWTGPAVFVLMGRNAVEDIHFDDDSVDLNVEAYMFQIGEIPGTGGGNPSTIIEDIVFANNKVSKSYQAIRDGGFPMRRMFIVNNIFDRANKDAIYWAGRAWAKDVKFNVEDSIIAHNTFLPGEFTSSNPWQGTIASQIGGGRRVDFSNNTADGMSGSGWRAAYFWHLMNNHEMLLVSRNYGSCTGSQRGDGEMIGYDDNENVPGFDTKMPVLGATANSVKIQGTWRESEPMYFNQHWVQVAEGKGVGQARKIVNYVTDASGDIVINVSPDWDVIPSAGEGPSMITVARQFWQVYTIDNVVDIAESCPPRPVQLPSDPLDPTSPPMAIQPKSGMIYAHGMTIDSVIEGNQQYRSDGIATSALYSVEDVDANPGRLAVANYAYFVEIRDNTIDQEFDFDSYALQTVGNSRSGIQLRYGSTPDPGHPCPVIGYGVTVSHNTITRADGLRGGAISLERTWYSPPPQSPVQYRSVLIHNNEINDVHRPSISACDSDLRIGGIGVHLQDSLTLDEVVEANTFNDVCYPYVNDGALQTP